MELCQKGSWSVSRYCPPLRPKRNISKGNRCR